MHMRIQLVFIYFLIYIRSMYYWLLLFQQLKLINICRYTYINFANLDKLYILNYHPKQKNSNKKKMQRSMVHQLSGLTSSQFINNRSTFISTAFNDGDYQLRKSRIQNLPSYRKQDLSTRPNFVIVFQTIQIQRLSNQIQALRIALKDQQRQNFNIQSYQVQIRELTQRCFAYENQRGEYREQIDKLNMICEKLYEEVETMKSRYNDIDPSLKQKYRLEKQRARSLEEDIQKWRIRYNALDVSKTKQMQDIKLMMQNQRKSMIDRQIKQLTLKSQLQRQNLQKQIRKLRQAYQNKDNELKRVNNKLLQLQILNKELKQYEKTIYEYQNKFAMLSQEMMRLNDILRRKEEEIDRYIGSEGNYKRRQRQFQRKIRELQQNGGQKAKTLQQKLLTQKSNTSKLQSQINQYKQQLSQIPQFKQAIQQINIQSQKLKQMVKYKISQIDTWKNKYQKVEAELRDNKIKNQEKIPVLENKVQQLNSQNDRLNNVIRSRTMQVENWKGKIAEIQKQILRFSGLEKDKINLQNQLNTNIKQMNDLQSNIRQLQNQNRRLEGVQKDLLKQKSQKQEGRKQIGRLNNLVKGTSEKIQSLERKCGNLERDLRNYTEIQEEIRIYKQKQISMTKQIDRINGIIVEKIKQIQALKQVFQRFEGKLTQYQGLQKKLVDSVGQTQKLFQDLDQSRKQAAMLQDKLLSTQSQSKKLKNDTFALTQEKQQLTKVLNTKTLELQSIQSDFSQLQNQVTRLRSFQARFNQVQEKYKNTQSKLGEITKKYKIQQNRYLQTSQKLQETVTQLMKVKRQGSLSPKFKQQYTQLIRQSQRRQRQIKNLQQRLTLIQSILKKLKQTTIKQDQITKKNAQRITTISKHFDLSAQAYKKVFDLQTQIIKLNQHIMSLQSKLNLTNIENQTYKQSSRVSNQFNIGGVLGVSKSQQLLTKSPIDLLATKRIDNDINEGYGSPSYSKSSSVNNILNPNTSTTTTTKLLNYTTTTPKNPPTYQSDQKQKYTPIDTPNPNPHPHPNTNTNTNTYNNNYSYFNSSSTDNNNYNTNTSNSNTDNYAYSYTYNSSTNKRGSSPLKNMEMRLRSNANFSSINSNSNTASQDSYSSYMNPFTNTNNNTNNYKTYQPTTNYDTPTYDYNHTTTNPTTQIKNTTITNSYTYKQQGLKPDTYLNFEAFSINNLDSKRSSLGAGGIKPAGLPLQFRNTNRGDF